MNYAMIFQTLGYGMVVEAGLMLFSLFISLFHREFDGAIAIGITIASLLAVGFALSRIRTKSRQFYARDGFAVVTLLWLIFAAFGALPFVISGAIPNYVDAYFEIMSGFTTTGASIILDLDAIPRGLMFWRCMTQWVGGMGVLVFMLAVLPMSNDSSMHLMRAEVPGPTKGKLVPRMRSTAVTLYLIYVAMSIIQVILLCAGKMPLYEAITYTFNTASTGGFFVTNSAIAGYDSIYIEVVITVFMLLFGVNFYCYYLILTGKWKRAFANEEVIWYFGIAIGMMILIAVTAIPKEGSFWKALRYSSFTVSSLMTTTGFSINDYNLWPQVSRSLIIFVCLLGGCAGSTAGGPKTSRLIIMWKSLLRELRLMIRPRSVEQVRMDAKPMEEDTIRGTVYFMIAHMFILAISYFLVAFDNLCPEDTVSAVISCLNNVGPGIGVVGPAGSYASLSYFSKVVLTLDMLLGRLEIFPILLSAMALTKRIRSYH